MKLKLLLIMVALAAIPASADLITCANDGATLYACATFGISGSNLTVNLRNTSIYDVMDPSGLLTAVFWSSDIPLTLSPVSAVLSGGSTVLFGVPDPGGVVGGEHAYASGLVGAPLGATYGISSAGFDLFGNANFPGNNLQGPEAVDGMQYGITSLGDNSATGNAPVTGENALIKNSVLFTLSGLPAGFTLDDLNTFSFQYGTSLREPNLSQVPEPATWTMMLVGAGMVGIGRIFSRRKKS